MIKKIVDNFFYKIIVKIHAQVTQSPFDRQEKNELLKLIWFRVIRLSVLIFSMQFEKLKFFLFAVAPTGIPSVS